MARSCSNRHFRASLRSQALPAPQRATEVLARGARFEYSETSRAGFVELAPGHVMTPEEFFAALQAVPGVEHVEWHLAKSAQHNIGDDYMEGNILAPCQAMPTHRSNSS